MPNVDIIYFDAGGGHRATAQALDKQLSLTGWYVNLINLRDVLNSTDPIKKYLGINIEDFYNNYVSSGWTLGSGPMLRILQTFIKLFNYRIENAIFNYWLKRGPSDLIVSVIPNFNKQLYNGIRKAYRTPYVTVMCDMADVPPHFWMESQDQYIICGTLKAVSQAWEMEYSIDKVRLLSGMIVNPKFYVKTYNKRYHDIRGVVSYGGKGSSNILTIAKMINQMSYDDICKIHIDFMCGNNEKLFKDLRELSIRYSNNIFGFVNNISDIMDNADFFMGKPGPGSISEALVKHLPVLVEDSIYTMVQERYNIEWITKLGFGESTKLGDLHKFEQFIKNLNKYKYNVSNYSNTGIFEIPQILTDILKQEKRI
jgi:1,2-diacylglycerol 3-beta-galactosyltransferase